MVSMEVTFVLVRLGLHDSLNCEVWRVHFVASYCSCVTFLKPSPLQSMYFSNKWLDCDSFLPISMLLTLDMYHTWSSTIICIGMVP